MSLASRPQDLCGLGMAFVILACGAVAAQEPAEPPINREQIDAALQLTRAAAKEYEFLAAGADAALELKDEPVLRWSNPTTGEVHGNVFLWTRGGRPMVVGSLFKWFSPHSHMSHEFQSLAEKPIAAKFHGMEVWKTTEPGLKFVELADAPLPARSPASRLLQLKQIARGFAATKIDRDGDKVELRLLTQPVYRYALPGDGVFDGALLAFVQGTDPEVLLLLEVRGADATAARWHFAATRMNSVELRLRRGETEVWSVETMPWREISDHRRVYTSFRFETIPAFLTEALDDSAR